MDWSTLRDVNLLSVILRTVLALVCGGIIGIERERRKKQAGFRTHMLICLGASITTLTSQYLFLVLGQYTDIARLGAQVIAGLGFIGAGAIVVTRRLRIRGLTTAAGLWATGILGLCCGAGYYEAAICATIILVFIEFIMEKFEKKYINFSKSLTLLIEIKDISSVSKVLTFFNELGFSITGMDVQKEGKSGMPCVIIEFLYNKKTVEDDIVSSLKTFNEVVRVEKIARTE